MVEKRDYVSNSEHSDNSLNIDFADVATGDDQHSADEEFNKKSIQMQIKG